MQPAMPSGADLIIQALDELITSRAKDKSPVVLPSGPGGQDLIELYEERSRGPEGKLLVPVALIPPPDDGDGEPPHIALVSEIADQFQKGMPQGSGSLRLPLFHTITAVLDAPAPVGVLAKQRRELRDHLFDERVKAAFHNPDGGGPDGGNPPAPPGLPWYLALLLWIGHVLARPFYGVWLRRRPLRWVSALAGLPGTVFVDGALSFTDGGVARSDHDLVQRLLLTALVKDLENATRRSVFSVRRTRRRWRFVLLLTDVNDSDLASLMRNYLEVLNSAHTRRAPLAVLGAFTAPAPPFACPLPGGQDNGLESLALALNNVLFAPKGAAGSLNAYELPLPGGFRTLPIPRTPGNPLPVREVRFWDRARLTAYSWRVFGAAVTAVVVAASVVVIDLTFSGSCWEEAGGQTVGITDGKECSLAKKGPGGDDLRKLLELVKKQNAEIDGGDISRTVVFYAPLSASEGSGNTELNGVQSLRGAVYAQHETNAATGKDRVKIRLLVANPGDAFEHGPAVTKKIIDRKDDDGIVAVIGITQSRQSSLDAVHRLSAAGIPIIASSTTGSAMTDRVTSPRLFYQVSPVNAQLAKIMATFIENSERIKRITDPASEGKPKAIVVYHPDDQIFSVDFKTKFKEEYGELDMVEIPYHEGPRGDSSAAIAKEICSEAARTNGVVVYAARAAIQDNLLDRMKSETNCRKDVNKTPFLAEAVSSGFVDDPAAWAKKYSFLSLFFTPFDASMGGGDPYYIDFDEDSTRYFEKKKVRYRPSSDAAGAYDTLRVASHIIDETLSQAGEVFNAGNVSLLLSSPGVGSSGDPYQGATGPITLNADHKFPPDKALYVLGTDDEGKSTVLLHCGLLPRGGVSREWGQEQDKHPCPR